MTWPRAATHGVAVLDAEVFRIKPETRVAGALIDAFHLSRPFDQHRP